MELSEERARTPAISRYLSLIIPVALASAGLIILIASFIPYNSIAKVVLSSGEDQIQRGADSLRGNFAGILLRLRYCSIAFLLVAVVTFVRRARLQHWIEEAVLPLPRFLRDTAASVARAWKAEDALHATILLALTFIGSLLRLRYLFSQMRTDEAETFLSYASRPLYIGLSWYPAPNNHLLHTLFAHFAYLLFGEREWAVRLPAFIAGILLVPLTYWAGRALYDKHSALLAAAFVAGASTLISYSSDARGYTMLGGFFLLLLIASQHLLEHQSQPAWVLWAIIAALGFYTIPIMLYGAGAVALWLGIAFARMPRDKSFRRPLQGLLTGLILTGALVCLLYLPVIIASGVGALTSNPWVKSKSLSYLFANFPPSIAATWQLWTFDVPGPLIWLLTACFVVAVALFRRIRGTGSGVLFATAVVIPALVLVQRVVPYARVWLFLLPLTAIVSGAGLWFLFHGLAAGNPARRVRLSSGIAVFCLAAMCVPDLRGTRLAYRTRPARTEVLALWIRDHVKPGDLLVARGGGWTPLTYYFRRHAVPLTNRPAPCDPMSLVYTLKGAPRNLPGGPRRALAVGLAGQDPAEVVSAACITISPLLPAQVIFEHAGLQVDEVYFEPRPPAKSK